MKIASDVSLQDHNTLGVPATADYFCSVGTLDELGEALLFARQRGLPVSILGGGSNTVMRRHVPGLVVSIGNSGIDVVGENRDSITIRVGAGENWHRLVMHCLESGWYGLENLALIPGRVGAAPIQNIGAYGVELSDMLLSVDVVDCSTGELRSLTAGECRLSYRDSIFKHELRGRVIVWSVYLQLSRSPSVNLEYPELAGVLEGTDPGPAEVAEAVIRLRRAKLPDPAEDPNVGSFFKNPILGRNEAARLLEDFPDIPRFPLDDGRVKFPAAWLIDRAGWKGVREGGIGVHGRQALVIVNYGHESGDNILIFSSKIADDIKQKYNVDLEMEPVILGRSD